MCALYSKNRITACMTNQNDAFSSGENVHLASIAPLRTASNATLHSAGEKHPFPVQHILSSVCSCLSELSHFTNPGLHFAGTSALSFFAAADTWNMLPTHIRCCISSADFRQKVAKFLGHPVKG